MYILTMSKSQNRSQNDAIVGKMQCPQEKNLQNLPLPQVNKNDMFRVGVVFEIHEKYVL